MHFWHTWLRHLLHNPEQAHGGRPQLIAAIYSQHRQTAISETRRRDSKHWIRGVRSTKDLAPKPDLLPCDPAHPASQLWYKNNRQLQGKQRGSISHQSFQRRKKFPLKIKQEKEKCKLWWKSLWCHLEGWARSVLGGPVVLTGDVHGCGCDGGATSSSYSTLTPIFSVFSR